MFESWSGRHSRSWSKSSIVDSEITIRDATPDDFAIIAKFNSLIAAETEDTQLLPDIVEKGVRALLADSTKGRYWLAESGGQVVAQTMVTYEWSDWRNGNIWWIQSVYVAAGFRQQGVFRKLFAHIEALARQAPDVTGIRLYVEKHNLRAKQTYAKLGMDMSNYQVMQLIFDDNGSGNDDA